MIGDCSWLRNFGMNLNAASHLAKILRERSFRFGARSIELRNANQM
jgi:hypothetical protein